MIADERGDFGASLHTRPGCVFSVGVGAWDSEFCAELSPGPSCGDEFEGECVSDVFEAFDLCDDFRKGLVHGADSSTESLSFDNT